MKNEINITIDCTKGEFSIDKYTCLDGRRCYLENALWKKGFKDVSVWGRGHTRIGKDWYKPLKRFDSGVVAKAFKNRKILIVNLIKK